MSEPVKHSVNKNAKARTCHAAALGRLDDDDLVYCSGEPICDTGNAEKTESSFHYESGKYKRAVTGEEHKSDGAKLLKKEITECAKGTSE